MFPKASAAVLELAICESVYVYERMLSFRSENLNFDLAWHVRVVRA